MPEIKLLPCPFCGKTETLCITREPYYWDNTLKGYQYQVVCDASCDNGGCGSSCGFKDSITEAKEAWNRRANTNDNEWNGRTPHGNPT